MWLVSAHLFDPGPLDPDVVAEREMSYGRRLTLRNRRMLDAGRHPITGLPVRDGDETCGSCDHCFRWSRGGSYFKCDLNDTRSEATDLRVSWPACTAWKARS